MPIIIGIESTAHTFGVGIVKSGKILSNVKDTYTTEHGGIIPMNAAKHHNKIKDEVYKDALEQAKIKEKDIDAVAFSQGPGLAPCLIEGMKFAKELSRKLKKPLVSVNHCIAHLEIGNITRAKDPVLLYASGANTQVIAFASGKYRVFGETLDIGVGNFIDNFARYAGIGFPGGPGIEALALKGNRKNYIELPYRVKGMDVALSGILTNLKQKIESRKYKIEDLAFSMQETVFAMLVETAERALAHIGKKELLLGGGVGCNKRLQEMCETMCEERGASFFVPENSLLVDNGAMIAFLGEKMFNKGIKFSHKNLDKVDIHPRERTDDISVRWK
ncbi:MAG: KEOPS complex N(6)-L-threonylcarbamoyladenine synthase Kae1 [Candidatus Nanoarchaeia archaeon]